MNVYNATLSVIVLGESQVGKTSLISRFFGFDFTDNQLTTIGKECYNYELEKYGYKMKIKIWDTAGQERFRSMAVRLIKAIDGIILVYAVDNKESFSMLNYWLNQIKDNIDASKIPIIIIGNKIDTTNSARVIQYEEGKKYADDTGFQFFETSCLTGANISKAFDGLFEELYIKKKDIITGKVVEKQKTVIQNQKKVEKKKNCCL